MQMEIKSKWHRHEKERAQVTENMGRRRMTPLFYEMISWTNHKKLKYQSQALIIMYVQESKPSPNVTVNTLKFPTLLTLAIENAFK